MIPILFVLVAVVSAYAGKRYGASVEAKGIARFLKISGIVVTEYQTIIKDIRVHTNDEIATLKKYL